MIDFSKVIAKCFLREIKNEEFVLRERQRDMNIKLVNIDKHSTVVKFHFKDSHARSINPEKIELGDHERSAVKICDYLVMLYSDGFYIPILFELTKVAKKVNLSRKLEQLYSTLTLLHYQQQIYSRTYGGKIKFKPPCLVLLYQIEKSGYKKRWLPTSFKYIAKESRETRFIREIEKGLSEYRYGEKPFEEKVFAKLVNNNECIDVIKLLNKVLAKKPRK